MTLIRHIPFKIKTMIVDSTLKEKLALIRHHGYENFLYFVIGFLGDLPGSMTVSIETPEGAVGTLGHIEYVPPFR